MSACGSGGKPGCGKEIVWGMLPDGTKVPLDLQAPVYCVGPWDDSVKAFRVERATIGYRANHFACCPKANNFTRPRTPAPPRKDARAARAGD